MLLYAVKVGLSAAIIMVVTELSKRQVWWGAMLASLLLEVRTHVGSSRIPILFFIRGLFDAFGCLPCVAIGKEGVGEIPMP